MNRERLLQRLLRGSTANVSFADFQNLVEGFGFEIARTTGSHHIYDHAEIRVSLNLQPDGRQAKQYQVRQFLKVVEEYNLKLEPEK